MADNQITPFQLTDQFTMDNFNQRINETNTALQKKAPAGYGLGTYSVIVNNADDINANGFYYANIKEPSTPYSGNTYLLHIQYNNSNTATQISFGMSASTGILNGTVRKRFKADGVWSEWEYINPPMVLGTEYRTIERYLGKPVYCKVVDCGVLPNATTKVVAHGIKNIKAIPRYFGSTSSSDGAYVGNYPMPLLQNQDALNGNQNAYVTRVTNNDITLFCGSSLAGRTAYVTMYYTKTTD